MMTYLLTYNHLSPKLLDPALHKYISDAIHVDGWWNYLPGVFIFNSSKPISELQSDFSAFMQGETFLIVRVIPHESGGWLPQAAWDWLNSGGKKSGLGQQHFKPQLPSPPYKR